MEEERHLVGGGGGSVTGILLFVEKIIWCASAKRFLHLSVIQPTSILHRSSAERLYESLPSVLHEQVFLITKKLTGTSMCKSFAMNLHYAAAYIVQIFRD